MPSSARALYTSPAPNRQRISTRIVLRTLVLLYALSCAGSLALLLIGTRGLFGVAPDGLAAVYAIVLAMPWSLLLSAAPGHPFAWVTVLLVAGMVVNVAIGWWLARPRAIR